MYGSRLALTLIVRISPDDQADGFAARCVEPERDRVGRGPTPGAALDALVGPILTGLTIILDLPEPARREPRCLRCKAVLVDGRCSACTFEYVVLKPSKGNGAH